MLCCARGGCFAVSLAAAFCLKYICVHFFQAGRFSVAQPPPPPPSPHPLRRERRRLHPERSDFTQLPSTPPPPDRLEPPCHFAHCVRWASSFVLFRGPSRACAREAFSVSRRATFPPTRLRCCVSPSDVAPQLRPWPRCWCNGSHGRHEARRRSTCLGAEEERSRSETDFHPHSDKQNAHLRGDRCEEATVEELKGLFWDTEGLPPDQRLVLHGKQLERGRTLGSYGVGEGGTVRLVLEC